MDGLGLLPCERESFQTWEERLANDVEASKVREASIGWEGRVGALGTQWRQAVVEEQMATRRQGIGGIASSASSVAEARRQCLWCRGTEPNDVCFALAIALLGSALQRLRRTPPLRVSRAIVEQS